MNRIFVAMVLLAFSWAAVRELQWTPPEPEPIVQVEIVGADSDDPQVRALAEEVARLKAAAAPAPAPVKRPMEAMQDAILVRSGAAVDLVLGLIGAMAFFLGLMRVAQDAGLMDVISKLIRPAMVRLFPDVPPDHPAMGAMVLNLSANALGLGNAATPFGIKAMEELDRLNPKKGTVTNAMVLFLAINTSSVTLLPTGVMVLREVLGSAHPADVMPTTLMATLFSTSTAIAASRLYQRFSPTPDGDDAEPRGAASEQSASYPGWVSAVALGLLVGAIPLTLVYGTMIAPWIIPGLTVGMIGYGAVAGVPVYESFVAGAREGWDTAVRIVPYLVAVLAAVGMLQASGALDALIGVLGVVTEPLGLPPQALPMALLRPLSGSGAYGVMVSTLQDPATGPDTYVGMIVSTLQGSTETTFYVMAVYLGAVGVTKMRHAVPAALTADLAGVIGAVVACAAWFAWNQ